MLWLSQVSVPALLLKRKRNRKETTELPTPREIPYKRSGDIMLRQLELINRTHAELTPSIEEEIREKAAKLELYYSPIMGCRVTVEAPARHHRKGYYDVHIDITVKGAELPVNHQKSADIAIAVRDAFDAARRKLEDYARHQRGDVKRHEEPPHGRVRKLFPAEGYGFLTTPDGQDVYFHRNSVTAPGFDELTVGTEVRFVLEQGDKGPQATAVMARR